MKPISLHAFTFRPKYYLLHPWTIFHEIKVLIQNGWHRMRYGYAWIDLWNTDSYITELVPNMLDALAEYGHGWPGPEKGYPQFSDWQAELRILAELIRITHWDAYLHNEDFEKAFDKWQSGELLKPIMHLNIFSEYCMTPEDLAAIEAEVDYVPRIELKLKILRRIIAKRIIATIDSWWD